MVAVSLELSMGPVIYIETKKKKREESIQFECFVYVLNCHWIATVTVVNHSYFLQFALNNEYVPVLVDKME